MAGLQAGIPKEQRLRGVFSSQEVRKVGTGTTIRKTVQKVFWFIDQEEEGTINIQPLNTNYVPTGAKRPITMEELLQKYSPEPEFYVQSVFPQMQRLEESIQKGDTHRDKNETFSAEHEYEGALKLDENNVKANFGIGLTYLSRGETDKAENIFERLVNLEAAFEEEHKHLFNDFGISLRKNKMFSQSVDYYRRALELTKADENLHINIARALMEEKDFAGCTTHLLEALQLDPRNEMAAKFLNWLETQRLVPQESLAAVQRALQRAEDANVVQPQEDIPLA